MRRFGINTQKTIDSYNELHDNKVEKREANYMDLVNSYYDVATAFYEWYWGASFHFAPRKYYEDDRSSLLRHEAYLAHRLRLKEGQKVLDVGCGIGGPLRNIAQMTGSHIIGMNNNAYQIRRGEQENKALGLDKTCGFVKDDFCKMSLGDNSFDAVYAIEATCHAPRRQDVYGEIFRVLKPGACFGCYEWCLTDKYDPYNEQHKIIKKNIEIGDGLPDLANTHVIDAALKEVGFEILETRDVIADTPVGDIEWYDPLIPGFFPPKALQLTQIGRALGNAALRFMEWVHIVPPGTYKVSQMLITGADGLVAGGKEKIFTPSYFFLVQKPL